MRAIRNHLHLWDLMVAIAVVAGLLAVPGQLVGMLVAPAILTYPIVVAMTDRKLGAAVWITSLYPFVMLFSFHAVWNLMGPVPGQGLTTGTPVPGYELVEPLVRWVSFLPAFLLVGVPIIWLICIPLMLFVACRNVATGKILPSGGALQLLIPVGAWLATLVFPGWGFGALVGNFLD
jgi:hypothetical protein